ncbi:DUF4924 family protein [Dysgonomonas sp. 520]|uniref:DUF4924 family protein n=1 Tax=Dysgonomonas sp. 520 TaxID=2302931 RepID=UPI0013D2CE8A|nr:DUF4924 family protein [Dysgonomonas sp. 520]NDW10280.1 DUF4924 family protein [Dysgonomonas sp. 520]
MLIAQKKKESNIAEYLLYMWQVEDLIRANGSDIDRIRKNIIDQYDQPVEVKQEIEDWYQNLIKMMELEGIKETGHLQINKNVIIELTDLHLRLLKSPQESFYIATYYNTLPFIVELRAKNPDKDIPEIETCFSAMYGYLLLKIQGREISDETQKAMSQISSLLRLLAEKYFQERKGELEI